MRHLISKAGRLLTDHSALQKTQRENGRGSVLKAAINQFISAESDMNESHLETQIVKVSSNGGLMSLSTIA